MRLSELTERAHKLKEELDQLADMEREYTANPNPPLSEFRSHRQRQERYRQIAAELTKLAESTAH
jgi:hypothetical protein